MRNLKRVLSLALALVMVLGMMVIGTSAATFTDADQIEYKEAIAVMNGIGLFVGNPDGTMAPKQVLTREQAATIIARIHSRNAVEKLVATKEIFSDVKVTDWSAKYVEYCYNTGLIAGNGDGTFNPQGNLTGIAFAKLLLVAMGYDADEQGYVGADWSTNIAVDALTAGLYIKNVDIAGELTREQAAQMILQALNGQMQRYINSFDKDTGKATIVGPLATGLTFAETYYPTLAKVYGGYVTWGRPIDFQWNYKGESIYTVMKTPVKVYTEAKFECDIAEDLGLYYDAPISKWTWNNVPVATSHEEIEDGEEYTVQDEYIELLGVKNEIGAQGRLVEIYKKGSSYEIVEIDTYLAQVTDVVEITYDRNNHPENKAELHMDVYTSEEAESLYLTATKDYTNKVGEWLLVYVNDANGKPVIVGAPETLTGAQTAWTYNNETHEVEDVEYNDAVNFYLDETERTFTTNYVWFFDLYGNLIGAIEPAKAPDTYGVISQIYWRDSRDGETGYAWTKVTYLDGTSKWLAVSFIDGVELQGVEGKNADYELGFVSSTKQYNEYLVSADTDFTNVGLYKIVETGYGIDLQPVESFEGQLITNQKTLLEEVAYANSKTMFLVYNEKKDTYATYVGVRNLPNYKDTAVEIWAADIENDTNAEYVFVIDPATKQAQAESKNVVALANADDVKVKANLKNNKVVSYTFSNILVDGKPGSVVFKADSDKIADFEAAAEAGVPAVLTITGGFVVDVEVEPSYFELAEKPDTFFGTAAVLGEDCFYQADDETLEIGGWFFDVADAKLIGARSWKAAEKAAMNVAVVYDADLVVSFVYFY